MASGSRIVVAEAFLTPSNVVWRVATGPGFVTAGGQSNRWSGHLDLRAWAGDAAGLTNEACRALQHLYPRIRQLGDELVRVQPLPLG